MNLNAVARIASLIGEPARTAMLLQLMDGRAMTATELANAAGITPATASRHLALMVEAELLHVTAIGRHRYHRIASPQVASLLESIMQVAGAAAPKRSSVRDGPKDESLRQARTCYDHLAGRLGVAIANKLADDRALVIESDSGWVTERAAESLGGLGLGLGVAVTELLEPSNPARRVLCRPCMDWSERRTHLAGRLGAAICDGCMGHGWLLRKSTSRAVEITPRGQIALRNWMGWDLWNTVLG